MRRPQRYHRGLRKVFYMAALNSSQRDGPSQEFYQRKRGEKRSAVHALIALARRLVDVVWALIRDNREWTPRTRDRAPPICTESRLGQPPPMTLVVRVESDG